MIMAIDVSNTNITLGTFKGEKLLKIYRVTTKVPRTSDEYGVLLRDLVRLSNASHHDIEGVIIASVVPNVMYSLTNACIKYFQAGIVYGTIGETEYIVRKMKEESGLENIKVVATGGFGKVIADETDVIDIYDNMLTLQGLRIIYYKNVAAGRKSRKIQN